MAEKNGWWVRVCIGSTEASSIGLWCGLGGQDGSHRYWRKWNSNDETEFDLPSDLRNVSEVWIKGEAIPLGRNAHICVCFRDHVTQKMEFDDTEEHETSQGDIDSCNC